MTSSSARVNPFYISSSDYDDIEDGGNNDDDWDDWAADDGSGNGSGRAEEQRMLIAGRSSVDEERRRAAGGGGGGGDGGTYSSSRHHHATTTGKYHQDAHHGDTPAAVRTFHRQGSPYEYRHDGSPVWKFGVFVCLAILFVLAIAGGTNNHSKDGDYQSLIDEAPNDELRLVVLGERHSGVSWMQSRLRECFPQADVSSKLQRDGSFFQEEKAMSKKEKDAIVVFLTLNVYDWLEQMRLSPEYAPNHTATHSEYGHLVPLEWTEFVSRPWTIQRPERDLPLQNNTKGRICQMGFRYNQIVSCVERPLAGTDNPMYELQQEDGSPFPSIMELRSAKLQNHHSVQNWTSVKKFITLPYEQVGKSFKELVLDIQQMTEWQLSCTGDVLPPSKDRSTDMTRPFVEYVTKHADWMGAERLVPYQPWTDAVMDSKDIQEEEEEVKQEEDEKTTNDEDVKSNKNSTGGNKKSPPKTDKASETNNNQKNDAQQQKENNTDGDSGSEHEVSTSQPVSTSKDTKEPNETSPDSSGSESPNEKETIPVSQSNEETQDHPASTKDVAADGDDGAEDESEEKASKTTPQSKEDAKDVVKEDETSDNQEEKERKTDPPEADKPAKEAEQLEPSENSSTLDSDNVEKKKNPEETLNGNEDGRL